MKQKKLFYFYLGFLFIVLFFRFDASKSFTADGFVERIKNSGNFIPFDTVLSYIKAVRIGTMSFGIAVCNLLGNLILFFPMGFFLPKLFPHLIKSIPFFLTVLITVTLIESLQLILGLGRFDVDDIILNITGAVFGFVIYKIAKGISSR